MIELADTSAWSTRHRDPELEEDFNDRVEDGEIATCEMVVLELLVSAQTGDDFRRRRHAYESLPWAAVDAPVWARAVDVFQELADQAPLHHRQVRVPDLIIAAAAEHAGMPLLHYDRHFETIAAVTGQPVRALAPLGSL